MNLTQLQAILRKNKPNHINRIDNTYWYEYAEYTYVVIINEKNMDISIEQVSNEDLEEMVWQKQDAFDEITATTTKQILALN